MRKVIAIAVHTFREAGRDRVLYGLVAFAALYILLDLFFARLALGDLVMIKSFGLAGIYIFGLVVTVFLGSSLIQKEIERRTLYFVLSKPVSRTEFVIGKFFGLLAAIFLTVALMAAIYVAVIAFQGGGFDYRSAVAIFMQLLEMTLLTALMTFLSTVLRPLTATLCSIMLLFAGHLLPMVLANARTLGDGIYRITFALYYLLPNLAKFDMRELAAHALNLSSSAVLFATAYAIAYTILLLILAIASFTRKEL